MDSGQKREAREEEGAGGNSNGNLPSRTDFNGTTTAYTYNNMNQLLPKLPDPFFHASAITCTCWPQGRHTMTNTSALTGYSCDNSDRLSGFSGRAGSLSCRQDLADNLTQISGSANTGNCMYDTLDRLSTVEESSTGTTTYAYDNEYNLQSVAYPNGVEDIYRYDNPNQVYDGQGPVHALTNATGAVIDDANGNTIVKTDGTGSTSYTWDYENRLASVILPGSGGTVSFKYDPFGRRIYKSSSSGTSIYAYDGPKLIEETNSSGTVVARYSQGESLDEPLAMLRSSTTTYYERDGLGSVTSLTDATGALAQTYAFDSFGNQTASSGSLTNPFQYVSREFDSEATLYFMRARYFDPKTGRFLSEDKIRSAPENANPYAYVGNAPVRFNDPMGFVRVDTSFPAKCLSDLMRAIGIVRRAAQANAKCNCQFKGMDQQGRSLQDLLDSPDITIHYDPVQEPPPDYEGPGELVGYTLPGDTNDIWMNPYACNMGRWTLASTLVHELTHIALKPGMGQEDKADIAKITCGFPQTVMPTTIVVRP